MADPVDDFNLVVGHLNEASFELNVLRKYWASFTAAQRTALKNLTIAIINQAITDLGVVKTEIGAL